MQGLFGGLIAVILLGVYVNLIRIAYLIVDCSIHSRCSQYPVALFNDQMAYTLSTIGGLVSALVIAELAVTKPGDPPGAKLLGGSPGSVALSTVKIVSVAYLLIWAGAGFWAFMISMYHPKVVPALDDLGHAWLGLAVAAGYAYFGLQRQ
jgi:hypothetical protein